MSGDTAIVSLLQFALCVGPADSATGYETKKRAALGRASEATAVQRFG
jgi:hypothetical protein